MIQNNMRTISPFGGGWLVAAAFAIVMVIAGIATSKLPGPQAQLAVPPIEHVSVANKAGEQASISPTLKVNAPLAKPITSASKSSMAAPLIARTAKVSLFVSSVDESVALLSRIAHRNSGDVFSLQVDNERTSAAKAYADMDIRVPVDHFEATMSALNQVGKIRQRSVSADDLTGDITESSARLRNLRRTESDIRKIMDRSGTVGQVLEAENQLSQVREHIETLESDLKSMHKRVVYSTFSISLEAEASKAPVEPTALAQLATAWRSDVHAISQMTVSLITAFLWFVVFAPYLVAAALLALVCKRFRKRWRTSVT